MQLVCPNCASSYAVADNALGERGRQVRCARCKHVWLATPPALKPAMEMADALSTALPASPAHEETPEPVVPHQDSDAAAEAATPHLDDAPPIAPESEREAASEPEPGSKHDYFAVRRRKVARKQAEKQRGWGFTPGRIAAAMAGIIIALLYARESVARIFPQTVSLYSYLGLSINLRGLEFSDVKTSYETQDGIRIMLVEGEIRNVTSTARQVAHLRFALRNASGMEIYTWTGVPDRSLMAPGETQRFRSRLASPPAERYDLRVRFLQGHDMMAAAKQ